MGDGPTFRVVHQSDSVEESSHSSGTGLDLTFVGTDDKGALELSIDAVAEGETGSDFPARVEVATTTSWHATGCVASLTEHRQLRIEASSIGELRHYQVSGEGSCTEALEAAAVGGEPVTIQPFTFRTPLTWRD